MGIDLILSDVVMPAMNGWDMAARIKAIDVNADVLFMSGYSQKFLKQKGTFDGQLNFIAKPFNIAKLKRKIEEIMHDHANQQED